jgi:hypothetical protein
VTRQKLNRILCILGLILSSILVVHDVLSPKEFWVGNVLTHGGMFISAAFFMYLNLKNARKETIEDRTKHGV